MRNATRIAAAVTLIAAALVATVVQAQEYAALAYDAGPVAVNYYAGVTLPPSNQALDLTADLGGIQLENCTCEQDGFCICRAGTCDCPNCPDLQPVLTGPRRADTIQVSQDCPGGVCQLLGSGGSCASGSCASGTAGGRWYLGKAFVEGPLWFPGKLLIRRCR